MNKIFVEVDLLGARGGMDQYVIPLLNSLSKITDKTVLITNSEVSDINICLNVQRLDFFTNFLKGSKIGNLTSFIFGVSRIARYLFFRDRKFKYLVHLHFFSYGLLDFLKLVVLLPFNIEIVATIHDVSSFRKGLVSDLFRNFILRNSNTIVVHNDSSKKALLKLYNDENQVEIIKHGNYCDFVNLFPIKVAKVNDTRAFIFRIGFIGQIKKVKNLEFVLDALSDYEDCLLVIKGKATEYAEGELIKLIQNTNVKSEYKFGYLPNSELVSELRNLNVIVLTYKEIYQSGILLLAMSTGAIVLCSNLSAFKEIVSDGVNGFLYEEGEKNSFQEKLNEIRSMTVGELQVVRNNALNYAQVNYSWDTIAMEYKKHFL